MDDKNKNSKRLPCIPLWCAILFAVAFAAFCIETLSRRTPALADFISDTSGTVIRFCLTNLTNPVPFSVAETVIICSPIIVGLIVWMIVRAGKKSIRHLIRASASVLAVASLFYSTFIFGYGTGYYGTTVEKKLNMVQTGVSAEELYKTGARLLECASNELENVNFPEKTYSSMTFSYSDMNKKLNAAWDTVCDKYGHFQRLHSNTKQVMLSEPWSYTHISGLYSFPSGEANVNVNYPDFIIVTSAAHEMAHQRGICLEAEANFLSFLVCVNSDDPYIRYSGYVDMYREVRNKLADADMELYNKLVSQVPDEIARELNAFAVKFEKYSSSPAGTISDTINDTYLEFHGQEQGIKSYGLVVDLLCSYMLNGEGAKK